ncbi:MAG: hypothetical protein K1X29_03105 [Bdellovibrionales bacterium]|nr:hypothetical protein [Bdellovibrionales bacterium]
MHLTLSVPSKTFLCGEYAVLYGGPAVLLGHAPRFKLQMKSMVGAGECLNIPYGSPGAQWIKKNAPLFKDTSLIFQDPHGGRGGFGASSAQFVLSYVAAKIQNSSLSLIQKQLNVKEMWQEYRLLNHGSDQLPSGGDVVSQWHGETVVFNQHPWRLESRKWPFPNLEFILIPTGFKVSTHEHLRERLPVSETLIKRAETVADSFLKADEERFVFELRGYGEELERLQLVTLETRGQIADLSAHSAVQVIKGCGALGADVILVILPKAQKNHFCDWLVKKGRTYFFDSSNIDFGLQMEMLLEPRQNEVVGGLV